MFFYLLTWKWDAEGNPIPETILEQKEKYNTTINLLDNKGNILELKQLEVTESHKTLGTVKCIFGPEADHVKLLTEKSNKFICQLNNAQLNRRMARKAFSMCYVPTMLYSLAATNLLEEEIDKIQQAATTAFIRIQGYEKGFPRALIYGPKIYGGIELYKLSVESSCNKIETILCQLNARTKLGYII
jgi:hypothetical protein